MRVVKNKAPTAAVGCTINTAQEPIAEILEKGITTFSCLAGKAEAHRDASSDQGIAGISESLPPGGRRNGGNVMLIRRIFVESICAVLIIASRGVAQSPAKTGVDVSIALKVAGQAYAFNGKGECTHAPAASIYGTAAQQWRVEGNNAQGSASLTLWRPAAGSGDMFSLHAATGGKSYVVSTVKTSGGGKVEGSGKVTFTSAGSGGTFTIDATAAKGGTITGTIKCSGFSPAVAEGG